MVKQQEKLWVYDAVEAGQAGRPVVVNVTPEHIARYALVAQNPDARYHRPGANPPAAGGALVAMPTMVLTYAPLLRDDIADSNGFVAQEQSRAARRQTPFAKCEIRWFQPVRAGDTITSARRVLEKYQRRGSKFVTFRVEAADQRGEKVAEYDYTCIFEYAGEGKQAPREPRCGIGAHPTLADVHPAQQPPDPASFLTFDSISVGQQLHPLTISESQEIINHKNELRLAGSPSPSNIHTDEEFARKNLFGGTVNSGPATMSYVDQMLERSFPLRAFYDGGQLVMRSIEPFRAGDTVTFQGEITAKRSHPPSVPPYQGGIEGGVVECRVRGINQRGDLVCLSDATLVLPH